MMIITILNKKMRFVLNKINTYVISWIKKCINDSKTYILFVF